MVFYALATVQGADAIAFLGTGIYEILFCLNTACNGSGDMHISSFVSFVSFLICYPYIHKYIVCLNKVINIFIYPFPFLSDKRGGSIKRIQSVTLATLK